MTDRPTFVEQFGDEAGEALWCAALALIARAIERAQEGAYGRWQHAPAVESRRLRRDLAGALRMARLATRLQELENDELRRLTRPDVRAERAEGQARSRRQAAGRYAAAVGRVRRRARLEGRDPAPDEFPVYADFLRGIR